jgi:hypothetical protein
MLDSEPFVVMPLYKNGNARNYLRDNMRCSRLRIVASLIFSPATPLGLIVEFPSFTKSLKDSYIYIHKT